MHTLLIVEDNEMNRDMLARRLQRRGYMIVTAVNGEEGVLLARSRRPDLILMDLSLPVMDGWEATRRIRADAAIPIIALTAHALPSDREEAERAGCDDFDTKPVDLECLHRQDRGVAVKCGRGLRAGRERIAPVAAQGEEWRPGQESNLDLPSRRTGDIVLAAGFTPHPRRAPPRPSAMPWRAGGPGSGSVVPRQ